MKKTLLASTALVGASLVASSAMAEITVGAFGKVGYAVTSAAQSATSLTPGLSTFTAPTNGEAFISDFEVSFSGSEETSIGTVGFYVEMAADASAAAGFDESSISLEGSWGQVILGNNDGAAGSFGINGTSGSGDMNGIWNAGASAIDGGINANGGDDAKITYMTPVFGGFQAAASYTQSSGAVTAGTSTSYIDADGDGQLDAGEALSATNPLLAGQTLSVSTTSSTGAVFRGGLGLGVKFDQEIAGTTVGFSANYASQNNDTSITNVLQGARGGDRDGYRLGASASMAGFDVAFGYISNTQENTTLPGFIGTDGFDTNGYNVGVGYSMGDTKIGLLYDTTTLDVNTVGAVDVDTTQYGLGVEHTLGEGVTISLGLHTGETDDGNNATNDDFDGAAVRVNTSW